MAGNCRLMWTSRSGGRQSLPAGAAQTSIRVATGGADPGTPCRSPGQPRRAFFGQARHRRRGPREMATPAAEDRDGRCAVFETHPPEWVSWKASSAAEAASLAFVEGRRGFPRRGSSPEEPCRPQFAEASRPSTVGAWRPWPFAIPSGARAAWAGVRVRRRTLPRKVFAGESPGDASLRVKLSGCGEVNGGLGRSRDERWNAAWDQAIRRISKTQSKET